jgi:hypothetical protein
VRNSRSDEKPFARAGGSAGSPAPAVGRRIGALLYWLLLVFIVTAGALSIIPEAFGIGRGAGRPDVDEDFCAREIRDLKADLLGHTSVLISSDSTTRADRLGRWDARFRALGTSCGVLEPARIDLETLRSNLEATSVRFRRSQGKLMKRIDKAVDRYARGQDHTTSTSNPDEH